jgi:flavin reductase (DIM6/NTAB) family NADH-FMN oxidoreductase RutF
MSPQSSPPLHDLTAEFKDAMRQHVSAVAIVTTWLDGRPWGMTVSAFSSICMDPPTVMTCLRRGTAAAENIESKGDFGINLLSASQVEISARCSSPGSPKFIDDHVGDGGFAVPAVAGARMFLDCAVSGTVDLGDHRVFFGIVRALAIGDPDEAALVYSQGAYRHNSFDHSIATGCI